MAKVTGLGGVFFRSRDVQASKRWYQDVLGLGGEWGIAFRWAGDGGEDPYSLLSPFKDETDYFAPSDQPFMINLRVDDLEGLLSELAAKGVEVLGTQFEDYGKFAWILDPDGIKIELWQQLGPAPA